MYHIIRENRKSAYREDIVVADKNGFISEPDYETVLENHIYL